MKLLTCLFLLLNFITPAVATVQIDVPLGNSPSLGAADAPVVMIEFIDFQ